MLEWLQDYAEKKGLWPDNCDGTYEAYCDDSRHYRNITAILGEHSPRTLDHMRTYWKDYKGNDEVFWQHEFNKHGTCVSTLEPDCFGEYSTAQEVPLYFDRAVELFDSLPTYHWLSQAGITPSHDKTYTLDEIAAALKSRFEGREVRLGCHYGQLNEIWYFYNVLGSLQSGKFIPTNRVGSPSTCPRTNIRYLPKREARTTSTTVPEPTTSPGRSFQGRGQLKVVRGGNTNACLISRGEWYVSGACATFVASRLDGDKFNLRSSKGHCAVVDGSFYCSQNVKSGVFEANGRLLSYNGSTSFSVDHIARGRRKERVYVGDDHEIALQIAWSS